jgi:hypothetical protein
MSRFSSTGEKPRITRLSAAVVLGALFAVAAWVSPAAVIGLGQCWNTTYKGVYLHVCDADQWLTTATGASTR